MVCKPTYNWGGPSCMISWSSWENPAVSGFLIFPNQSIDIIIIYLKEGLDAIGFEENMLIIWHQYAINMAMVCYGDDVRSWRTGLFTYHAEY